jgi:hypothetical protein
MGKDGALATYYASGMIITGPRWQYEAPDFVVLVALSFCFLHHSPHPKQPSSQNQVRRFPSSNSQMFPADLIHKRWKWAMFFCRLAVTSE